MAVSDAPHPPGRRLVTLVPGPYRELTIPAILLGVVIGSIMTSAFVYIALKLGFSLSGSSVAAILGFGALRAMVRNTTIVENNINQTIASGVNNASAGISFTLPALFLLGIDNPTLLQFDPMPFVLAALAGTFMGVVIIIPLRKQMIEFERLRFPSGIAVAALLKSPGAGARQAKLLVGGFLVATFFTVLIQDEIGLLPPDLSLNAVFDGIPAYIPIAVSVSFASLGAGLLSGRGGLPFVLGGMLAFWLVSPIAVVAGWAPDTGAAHQDGFQAASVYGSMLRPLGIGVLIGGALAGVVAAAPALRSAIKSLSAATRAGTMRAGGGDEMSSRVLYLGLLGAFLMLLASAILATDDVTTGQAVMMAVLGVVWLAVAGLIVAQATGMTDISPLSGMALIAVTIMFFISSQNIIASVLIGVAICIGIGQCADMMTDLKSGHLIGSIPKRQQLGQFAVAWVGAPLAIGVLFLIWSGGPGGAGGFGPGTDLSAPQGQALASIISSLQDGNVALDKYLAGAGVGAALSIFPVSGIGVLVGLAMYLPIAVTLSYGVGCFLAMWLRRRNGAAWISATLVPIAAGFIIGEALTALTATLVRLVAA